MHEVGGFYASVTLRFVSLINNRNRKLEISTAPTKSKSREPAYSQALFQNHINHINPEFVDSNVGSGH